MRVRVSAATLAWLTGWFLLSNCLWSQNVKQNPVGALWQTDVDDSRRILRGIVMISGDLNDAPVVGAGLVFGRGKDSVYIVTANHVVRRGASEARSLRVRFKDLPDVLVPARLSSHFDASSDIAVIEVEGLQSHGLNPCSWFFHELGDQQRMKRGDPVVAVGNPNGFGWGMSVNPDVIAQVADNKILFQSTFISAGHSGGGLIDQTGALIGLIQSDQPPYGVALGLTNVLQMLRDWGYLVELYQRRYKSGDNFDSMLAAAVATGDLKTVQRIVAACPNVNIPGFLSRWTALHAASIHNKAEIAKFLIAAGAALEMKEGDNTPLLLASYGGSAETAAVLLAAGAAVDSPNRDGKTPLDVAAQRGHAKIMSLLLAHGAAVEGGNPKESTPLLAAAHSNREEAVRVLLAHGAAVNARDGRRSWTPLHAGATNIAIVKALLAAGADVRAKDSHGKTPLHQIPSGSEYAEVRELLRPRK